MSLIRLIVFTIVIPGFVVGFVPFELRNYSSNVDMGPFKYFGILLIVLGMALYIWSAMSFLLKGKGTPAIWFVKHLKFLIGEEPIKLVASGLYQISRNPMYLGILSIVLGQGIYCESTATLYYSALLAVFFHVVIVVIEEPHLRKKFGLDYEDYFNHVPRWIGFNKKQP